MTESMETLVAAEARFRKMGYVGHWVAQPGGRFHCSHCDRGFDAADVQINHIVRFEGDSDPADESILYALTGPCNDRGLYSSSYGADSTVADSDVASRLET